jgi:hypothetical protein
LAETVFDDTPWLDAVVQNRPLCGTRTGQSLVPMSDIKPLPGRRGTQVGVQKCDGFITALHFFEALFSREICATFIAATNSYARANDRAEWEDVTMPEFKVFLALLLYFGIVTLPSRRMAWENDSMFSIPWVASKMPVKRSKLY